MTNENLHVVLIDDHPIFNSFHYDMLKRSFDQIDISQFTDAEHALKFIHSNPMISFILCDKEMPRMNGWEFVSAYEEQLYQRGLCKAKVYMISAELEQADLDEVAQFHSLMGCYAKPFKLSAIQMDQIPHY